MNLTGRPIYQKGQTAKKAPRKMRAKSAKRLAFEASPRGAFDAQYMALVHDLPCCICQAHGEAQNSPTQAHHPIHGRHGTRKAPDTSVIPLCEGHHQGLRDTSKVALHQEPSKWKRIYGEDHEHVEATQDAIAMRFGVRVEDRPE